MNPEIETVQMAPTTVPTAAQVFEKFNEMCEKYHGTKGSMLITIPDKLAHEFIDANSNSIWVENYNYQVSDKVPILSTVVVVELFGHNFKVRFDRPVKPEHRSEFETYFDFGGHCIRYTDKRIIGCFQPRQPDDGHIDAAELLARDPIDESYVKRALALLVLGGYVKYWDAYYEFSEWFASFNLFPDADVRAKDVILPYIFEHMVSSTCPEIGV